MYRHFLIWVFWFALIARLAVAILRYDMHWPDEHFQTLEPAAKVVFGYGLMSWEWVDGFRSWIMPSLFIPLFWFFKTLGITGGLMPILFSRILFAIASLGIIWGLDRIQANCGYSRLTRWCVAVWISFSIPMLLWAPATLSDTWVTALWWGLLPLSLQAIERKRGFFAGFLASLPFLFRFQTGILGAVFGILVFLNKKSRAQTFPVFLGGLTNLIVYGLVDAATLGMPFASLYRQLTEGLKKSEFYGVSPWWDYFPKLSENFGPTFCISAGILIFLGVIKAGREIKLPSRWIQFSFLPVIIYTIVHIMIPHKETRFLVVLFPAIFLALGMSIEQLTRGLPERWRELRILNPVIQTLVQILLLISITLGSLFALKDRSVYLTTVDTAALLDRIYREEKHQSPSQTCVLLIENNWSFTRGSLGMGRQYAGVDRSFDQLKPQDFKDCGWVIARSSTFQVVENRARAIGRKLEFVTETFSGFALYR